MNANELCPLLSVIQIPYTFTDERSPANRALKEIRALRPESPIFLDEPDLLGINPRTTLMAFNDHFFNHPSQK